MQTFGRSFSASGEDASSEHEPETITSSFTVSKQCFLKYPLAYIVGVELFLDLLYYFEFFLKKKQVFNLLNIS